MQSKKYLSTSSDLRQNQLRRRVRFAQNFLTNQNLISSLISQSNINRDDLVYEIGPGEGIITEQLSRVAKKVIAIEIDDALVKMLRSKFDGNNRVEICHGDFMQYQIASSNYKIFANIPFNITSDIVKKVVHSENPPTSAYLIMQKEAALKFSGEPNSTEFSILFQPWFYFRIVQELKRQDFDPIPSVDPVFFLVQQREEPFVPANERFLYERFVKYGFEAWKKNLKIAFKDVFTYNQWKRLSQNLGFPLKATPSELTFTQWLRLFQFFSQDVTTEKQAKVKAFEI